MVDHLTFGFGLGPDLTVREIEPCVMPVEFLSPSPPAPCPPAPAMHSL